MTKKNTINCNRINIVELKLNNYLFIKVFQQNFVLAEYQNLEPGALTRARAGSENKERGSGVSNNSVPNLLSHTIILTPEPPPYSLRLDCERQMGVSQTLLCNLDTKLIFI